MFNGSSENSAGKAGCLALICGLVLLFWGGSILFGEARFRMMGRRTAARVTYNWSTPTKRGSVPQCYYAFRVNDREFNGRGSAAVSPGQEIWIEYLANDPTTNRIATGDALPTGLGMIGVSIALLGIGAYGIHRSNDFTSG